MPTPAEIRARLGECDEAEQVLDTLLLGPFTNEQHVQAYEAFTKELSDVESNARADLAFLLAEHHRLTAENKMQGAFIAKVVDVASVFQVGGELHEVADLRIGDSTVYDGFRWLFSDRKALLKKIDTLLVALRAILDEAENPSATTVRDIRILNARAALDSSSATTGVVK